MSGLERCDEEVEDSLLSSLFHSKLLRESGQDQLGIAERGQRDEVSPIPEGCTERGCNRQTQASFPYTAWPHQGQGTHIWALEEGTYGFDVLRPPQERCEKHGRIPA